VKPDFVADEIDRLWPNLPKIELFARRARPGWDRWGADAPVDDATISEVITATAAVTQPCPLRTPRTLTESRCPDLRRSDSGLRIPVGDEAA